MTNPIDIPASHLMEISLDIESFDQCVTNNRGLNKFVNRDKEVCTTSKLTSRVLTHVCNGDSGGPLFTFSRIQRRFRNFAIERHQIGITSFGTTPLCAQPGSVTFYTRFSYFYEAITPGLSENYTSWKVFTK